MRNGANHRERAGLTFVVAFVVAGATILLNGAEGNGQSRSLIPDTFDCQTKQYFQMSEAGLLQDLLPEPKTESVRQVKDAHILVDRRSGKVLTKSPFAYIFNWDIEATVLEPGSHEQAFKAIYKSTTGYLHVAYLQIQTYASTKEMPFILVDGSSVYSGLCS